MQDFSEKVLGILKANDAQFRFFEHEAAYSFEELEKIGAELGFQGTELKNLLLTDKKSKRFFLAITSPIFGRVDMDFLAEHFGEKRLKFASEEKVANVAHAAPGCVSPFGFSDEIPMLVDTRIFDEEKLLFSAGAPDNTVEIDAKDFEKVLRSLPNPIEFLSFGKPPL